MKINYDYWWLARQQWIDSLQTKPGSEIRDVVRMVLLGILLTACLIVWHYGIGFGYEEGGHYVKP